MIVQTKTKDVVWCDAYVDGKLTKSSKERRMIYTRPNGTRFIRTYWKGREDHELDAQNHWRLEARTVKMTTFSAVFGLGGSSENDAE